MKLCADVWLPCSKDLRRMTLCVPRFDLVQKALGTRNCVCLGLAALFKRLYAHEIVCAKVWLPCSKGFRAGAVA